MAFSEIDWARPWYAPIRTRGAELAASDDWIRAASCAAASLSLKNHRGLPLTFVPQSMLPEGCGYEAHISATGQVPTRDNLHDFFNALAWLHFPQTKLTLNALHAASLQQPASPGTRGRQRDAATLFDENAAFFVCNDDRLAQALRQHRWDAVLERQPGDFHADCAVMLFGHALLEKLVAPFKSLTAHVWVVRMGAHWHSTGDESRCEQVDAQVAAAIADGFVAADFCHLPVLGVPGWWPGQDAAFYADRSVFRPLKSPSESR